MTIMTPTTSIHRRALLIAIPAVKDGKSLVVVLFALPDGKTSTVNVDLR